MTRNKTFDLLKFIAALCIVFHHYQNRVGGTFSVLNFSGGRFYVGNLVELFFILSGFVMYPYIKKIADGLDFATFFKKRFLRYTPAVILSVLAYDGVALFFRYFNHTPAVFPETPDLFATLLTMLSVQCGWCFPPDLWNMVNSPLWYVSVLQFCYVLFFFCTYLASKKDWRPVYVYGVSVLLAVGGMSYEINLPFYNNFTCRGVAAFFWGVLFAAFLKSRTSNLAPDNVYRDFGNKKLQLLSAAILVFGSLCYWRAEYFISPYFNHLLRFLFFPALIYFVCSLHFLTRLLQRSKLLPKLGDISFWMYVLHMPFVWFFPVIYYYACHRDITLSLPNMLCFTGCLVVICAVIDFGYKRIGKN